MALMLSCAWGASDRPTSDIFKLPTLAPILRHVTPGVVAINIKRRQTDEEALLSGEPQAAEVRQVSVAASGVIFDAPRGLIITCAHLIDGADEIRITLSDGRVEVAERAGADTQTDVAVLKIAADRLQSVKWGDSSRLKVGDFVISVGNPFGIGQTVSFGLVSGLRHSPIQGYDKLIQTDAAMNPGDSGGALVNLHGELVGMDTAIVGDTGTNVGIGFAIPVNIVRQIAEELVSHGEVRRGQLGVTLQELDADIKTSLGLAVEQSGALVAMVRARSPAERAGIQEGDVITAINGKAVKTMGEAGSKLGLMMIGETTHLMLLRNAKNVMMDATLAPPDPHPVQGRLMSTRLAGAEFGPVNLFIPVAGAEVVSVQTDSAAWVAGFREGDVIRSLNHEKVASPEHLTTMFKTDSEPLLFNIVRKGKGLFLAVPTPVTR